MRDLAILVLTAIGLTLVMWIFVSYALIILAGIADRFVQ